VMIVFMDPDRVPEAVRQNADRLSIKLVNVKIERLDDVFTQIDKLGELVHEPAKAAAAKTKLREQLRAVSDRVANLPKVKTLVVRDETAREAVGRDTFIDDVLTLAGGENI